MFVVALKTLLTEAIKRTFDADYIEPDFRNIHASIEFPAEVQDYPGIWVDYAPGPQVEIVGVAHQEVEGDAVDGFRSHTRWAFDGTVQYTVVALSSLERDRLLDEVIRVVAFGTENEATSEFRAFIEDNEFLAVNFNFDQFSIQGMASTPGTPWQTDEIIYEATVAITCFGEFVADSASATLVPLTAIEVQEYVEGEPDPWIP